MHTLILGCGYLGGRVAAAYHAAGHAITALTRSPDRAADFRRRGWQPVVGDVLDPGLALPAADVVVYAVGFDRAAGRPMRQVYVDGLANVLDRLPPPGVFVYVGSTGVYGQTDGSLVDEAAPTDPADEAGQVVLAAEDLLRRAGGVSPRRTDVGPRRAVLLRFAGIYGPGRMLRAEALRRGEPVPGDPDGWLNLIHVEDGVRAVRAAADRGVPGGTYNDADAHPVRRRDFFAELARPMPVHDWTRVLAGTFHDFHNGWIIHLKEGLNEGGLPAGYYAQSEQHTGLSIADVITLRSSESPRGPSSTDETGAVAVAAAPPQASQRLVAAPVPRPRTVTVRHASGHHVVALIEIVSPANFDRPDSVRAFTRKASDALRSGVHLLIVDLFPPGRHAPRGMPERVWRRLTRRTYRVPDDRPLTLAAFVAGPQPEAYLDHVAVGATLRDRPLFLSAARYVPVPLEATYQAAYRGMPAVWRDVLDRPPGVTG
jgi:nucleoside-diphosphate-sugar epimerase